MLSRKTGFFIPFLLILSLTSCVRLGINPRFRTARKEAKPPRFTIKDSLKGSLTKERACFDVKYYDIDLRIDPFNKQITGDVDVLFTALYDTRTIQLDLAPQLIVEKIIINGNILNFERKHTALLIHFPDSIRKDETYTVKLKYKGTPSVAKDPPWKGGVVWKKDKAGFDWCGVACEGEGSWAWLPIKGYLGDKPDSIKTHFTVPSHLACISNGKFCDSIKVDDKWTCYTWKTSYPVNPYNITFYIGKFKKIELPYITLDNHQMNLDFYVLETNYEKAKTHLRQAIDILKTYEGYFGPYPWPKDGYKLIESPYAGMEHQTAIAYGNEYKNTYGQDFDYIVLHETAHEWWGNAVSVNDFSDVWIHEGIASFSEALFVEKTKGKKAYYDYMWGQGFDVVNRAPIILPKGVYYWNYKDGDVYMKGSIVLNTFRNVFQNDSLFLSVLREFNVSNRNKNVRSEDFFNLLQSKTDKNLTPLIEHYFYKRESPLLRWNFTTDENGNDVFVAFFERVSKDFVLPVTVEQEGKIYRFEVGTEINRFKLSNNNYLTVNPDWSYFQQDRINHLR